MHDLSQYFASTPALRLMLAVSVIGSAVLTIANVFMRGTPHVFRVLLAAGAAYFITAPTLTEVHDHDGSSLPAGVVLYPVTLFVTWILFRPEKRPRLRPPFFTPHPPADRFLW